jgi:GntR family transcriptional regulator
VHEQRSRKTASMPRGVGTSRERVIRLAHDALRASIRRGLMGPDSPLVEFRLVRSLGIGRNAVRESLRQLAEEGLVVRRPAIGTIIPRPMIRVSADEIVGFDGDSEEEFRRRVEVQHLATEPAEIGEVLRETLRLPDGPLQMVETLIHVDDEPLCLLTQVLPAETDLQRMTMGWEPLAGPFERLFGVPLGETSTMVEAILADGWTATQLGTVAGAPLILREQVLVSRDKSVTMMNFARYRADRVAFTAAASV